MCESSPCLHLDCTKFIVIVIDEWKHSILVPSALDHIKLYLLTFPNFSVPQWPGMYQKLPDVFTEVFKMDFSVILLFSYRHLLESSEKESGREQLMCFPKCESMCQVEIACLIFCYLTFLQKNLKSFLNEAERKPGSLGWKRMETSGSNWSRKVTPLTEPRQLEMSGQWICPHFSGSWGSWGMCWVPPISFPGCSTKHSSICRNKTLLRREWKPSATVICGKVRYRCLWIQFISSLYSAGC